MKLFWPTYSRNTGKEVSAADTSLTEQGIQPSDRESEQLQGSYFPRLPDPGQEKKKPASTARYANGPVVKGETLRICCQPEGHGLLGSVFFVIVIVVRHVVDNWIERWGINIQNIVKKCIPGTRKLPWGCTDPSDYGWCPWLSVWD